MNYDEALAAVRSSGKRLRKSRTGKNIKDYEEAKFALSLAWNDEVRQMPKKIKDRIFKDLREANKSLHAMAERERKSMLKAHNGPEGI